MVLLAGKHGALGQTGPGRIEGTSSGPASVVIPSAALKVTNDQSDVVFETQANASTFHPRLRPPETVLLERAAHERAPGLADD